ncbi:MAG: DNA ligase D [Elusimicrobiota bacterium]
MALEEYRRKRKFDKTPEPEGKKEKTPAALRFVVQKHRASRLHYDFRLEMEGVLKSWAVPKGPSLDPRDKRLAMMTEDHPLEYRTFEGVIPEGNYGAGAVMVWDEGSYRPAVVGAAEGGEKTLLRGLRAGRLSFVLDGRKLRGEWSLVKMKDGGENAWLLMKKADGFASREDVREQDRSAATGRGLDEITRGGKVWLSNRKARASSSSAEPAKLDLSDAPRAPRPRSLKPMLATLADEPFDRRGWIFEIKWDGYRALAEADETGVRLYSRNDLSFTERFAPVAEALRGLGRAAVIDGEITAQDDQGRASFQSLQNYQKTGQGRLVYCAFDILWLDGRDLRGLPLLRRKEILSKVLPADPRLAFSEHIEERGTDFLRAAAARGLEGVMAKDAHSPYRAGVRSREWLKLKTAHRQEAVIGGYTEPRGVRRHLGALILGVYDEAGGLAYIGHAGGGFTDRGLAEMRKRLEGLERPSSPFARPPKTNAPARWVEPRLVAEVAFQEWTGDGRLRMPIFLGLREDKRPEDVRREAPEKKEESTAPRKKQRRSGEGKKARAAGRFFGKTPSRPASGDKELAAGRHRVKLTHPDKVWWPDEKYTKSDVAEHYRAVAPLLLPYLKDRPQSLHRHPDGIAGESFYQKNFDRALPPWVATADVRSESENRNLHYMLCQNEATLLYMVNLGCIEINPWNSRVGGLDRPDYFVVDLDPEDVPFEKVIETALVVRDVLRQAGADGHCKTSGGRGLHIFVPLGARYTYDQARVFSEIVVNLVHRRLPALTSLERSPLKRQKKVYLDFLQNRRGQTVAAAYSVRPKPGAPVSTPLRWSEVKPGLDPRAFNLRTMGRRLARVGDLWKPVLGPGIPMEDCLRRWESLLKK